MNASPLYTERLLPLLVHIQTSLEGDLSLQQLADLAGMSPFHFHRLFHQAVGETLKQYTQRLRLERAAHELRIRQASILQVALDAGYQSHETFTRAFKRHFGHDAPDVTPPDKLRFDACLSVPRPFAAEGEIGCQILPAGHFAIVSYIGPYGATLEQAYPEIFGQVAQLEQYDLIGLPLIEIYRTTHINPDYALNQTDICIPVVKKR